MKYSIDKQETYATMKVGESNLNSLVSSDLKSELVLLKTEGVENLILDLSQVEYIDSSGLSAILTGNRLWDGGANCFVVTEITSPTVKKLIEISKLDQILSIVPTLSEAEDFIKMSIIENELSSDEE